MSPITGKWRIETVSVNRPVRIAAAEVAKLAGGMALAQFVAIPRKD